MANKKGNRQIERTRKAIVNAYLALLQESPSKSIKISAICDRANISRPTFYNHFQTKDEILLTYLDEILDEMFIEYRDVQLKDKEVASINFISASTQFFFLWQSKANLYKLIKNVQAEDLLISKLKDHHLKTYYIIAVHKYPLDDPTILDYFIAHISYVFFSVLDQWMKNGMKRTPQEMGELLAILWTHWNLLIENMAQIDHSKNDAMSAKKIHIFAIEPD